MGGTRAKERRRIKREAANGTSKTVEAERNTSTSKRLSTNGDAHTSLQETTMKTAPHNPKHQPEKMKKKVKKPKHLKRKLETMTEETEKETVRKTLEDFERKKEQRSKAKKQKIEKRKAARENSSNNGGSSKQDEEPEILTVTEEAEKPPESQIEPHKPVVEPKAEKSVQVEPAKRSIPDEKPDHGDSDDSSVEDSARIQRRRGKRRRGRKDTSQEAEESAAATTLEPAMVGEIDRMENEKDDAMEDGTTRQKKKKREKDSSRYCVGRKPITDFIIGQSYPGKVVYVKPFGVFVDIKSHSDAFCHVSRLRDEFVEDPTAIFKEGDQVQVRVVEIDRQQKRITVSMQSEAMIESERKSVESRKGRLDKRGKKSSKAAAPKRSHSLATEKATRSVSSEQRRPDPQNSASPVKETVLTKPFQKDGGVKTPGDLKRERKLARRAERRAQKAQNETSPASQ